MYLLACGAPLLKICSEAPAFDRYLYGMMESVEMFYYNVEAAEQRQMLQENFSFVLF